MRKFISVILAAVLALCALGGCSGGKDPNQGGKLKILTTIAPQYDWLKNITKGAKNVSVDMLLSNGIDLHSFQPSTDDIYQITSCDVFIYTGGESDSWVNNALKNNKKVLAINLLDLLGDKAKQEEAVEGMQEDKHKTSKKENQDEAPEYDEHVWLSIKNAEFLTEKLSGKLSEKDSDNKELYEQNTKEYIKKLQTLDAEFTDAIGKAKYNTLIFADRFPFRYLTDDYNLKYYAAFSGCSAETEASFETVKYLSDKLTELNLPAIMTIDGSDKKIAATVRETSDNKTAEIYSLNSMQSMRKSNVDRGNDYIEVMEYNLNVLKKALG